jgi:hypothetical protein
MKQEGRMDANKKETNGESKAERKKRLQEKHKIIRNMKQSIELSEQANCLTCH